jgi:hypothetical protein
MFLLSGQKGRDAMKSDLTIDSGVAALEYRHPLLQRVSPYLRCLQGLPDPAARRRVRWTPLAASLAAVLMVLDTGCCLAVRCQDALAALALDFHRRRRVGRSYNGLFKALVRQASGVLPRLKADLRQQARAALEQVPRVQGWVLLAVDGSKAELPRTCSLERHFGIADNGKHPQALITAIVEVFTGLLWDWRIGPGRGSEKHQLMDMVDALPASALLLADGNFVGYPVWSALMAAGQSFLIRVGGNVGLIRALWPEARFERHRDVVYAWPRHAWKQRPPLQLRLIKVQGGKDPVYLLTNVLDHRRLKPAAAGRIYRRRWGVELFYRTLKRTVGYAKLHSRSGPRAMVELEWALVTLTLMSLLGIAQLARRQVDRRRFSPAGLLQTLRAGLLRGAESSGGLRALDRALGRSFRDAYRRRASKQSRHRPITRNTPFPQRLKPPRVRRATTEERQRARQIRPHWAA